jgi:Xaa-Pro aminopeptidase
MTHREVQDIARNTMRVLREAARPGMTEKKLVTLADESQRAQGVKSYWYHGLPALLFAGERTILSQSGSEYTPTDYAFKDNDIITVDLSPEVDGLWADYARTIILQAGKVVDNGAVIDLEFRAGLEMEDKLHAFLVETATADMTFHQLHTKVDVYLRGEGFENLDFLNNFGHSIVEGMPTGTFFELKNDGRIFFDAGNNRKLSSVRFFTFEPHIRRLDGKYGYKREDIYTFENGRLVNI